MKSVTRLIASLGLSMAVLVLAGPASAQAQDLYRVRMSAPGAYGLVSDCSVAAYVLALTGNGGGKALHSTGSELDADGSPGPDLFLNFVTSPPSPPVAWSRSYNVGRGLSGTFDGCYGETFGPNGYSGNLWIFFETSKGKPSVRFLWHFDYYVTPGNTSREHFTMTSGKIPFVAWTGADLTSRVSGLFLIEHYLKEGRNISVQPVVSGHPLEFDLMIEKVQ